MCFHFDAFIMAQSCQSQLNIFVSLLNELSGRRKTGDYHISELTWTNCPDAGVIPLQWLIVKKLSR